MQTCPSYMLRKTHWPVETRLYPAFERNWREQLHAPPRPDVCVISERQEDEMSLSQLVPPKPVQAPCFSCTGGKTQVMGSFRRRVVTSCDG